MKFSSDNFKSRFSPPTMGTPRGAPGAPIPGLAPATAAPTFATHVYNDPTKDADNGNYSQVLAPFIINPNNIGNSLTPEEIRNCINGRSTAIDPLALGILGNGRVQAYLCPQRLDQPLGQPNHDRWNHFMLLTGICWVALGTVSKLEIPSMV